MNPVERRIRAPSVRAVYSSTRDAFPGKTDREIVAELTRMIVFVAVSYNDVVEAGADPHEILRRHIFEECDDLAGFFPWPHE